MSEILGIVSKESIFKEIISKSKNDLDYPQFQNFISSLFEIDINISSFSHSFISHCGNYGVFYTGEIYNSQDLFLKLPAFSLQTDLQAEIILKYLCVFGYDGIQDLNGMFGLIFLDLPKQKLAIMRDRFGMKTLYFRQTPTSFAFASEIDPLSALSGELHYSQQNLATLLRLRYLPAPLTLFAEIQKLRPGHKLELDFSNNNLAYNISSFENNIPLKRHSKTKSLTQQYGELLERAVISHLKSTEEVGILLSGGIDSAVVATLAQRNAASSLKAFTVGFEGDQDEDEIDKAAELAHKLGLEHHTKKISFDNFLEVFQKTIHLVEEPLGTTSIIPMYYLSELASRHVKIVLSGQGSDESMGGYKKYQGELISHNIPRFLVRAGNKIVPHLGIKNESVLRALQSLGEKDDIKRFLYIYSTFDAPEILSLMRKNENQALGLINYVYSNIKFKTSATSLEKMMAIDLRMSLSDDLLMYTGKITQSFNMECRLPFLDNDLIEFIESLSQNKKIRFGKGKIIHKEFAQQILTSENITRKKLAFESPTKIWFTIYNDQIKDLLLQQGVFTEIFDTNAVHAIIDQHLRGYNREKQIFLLLGIYYWLQDFEKLNKKNSFSKSL